jgi:hypothetical protein
MDHGELKKPEHIDEQDWLRHLQWMAEMGRLTSESYAEHLARVTQDADHSKALLQARYRALHAIADAQPGERQTRKD